MKIILMLILSLIASNVALADQDTIYHCPSIKDIKYERGTFTATTDYNGVHMQWFTAQNFPEANVPILKFNFTNNYSDCIGGTCALYCVYEIQSKGDHMLKFSVSRQTYRFTQPESGQWDEGTCASAFPEDCLFRVVKNPIF